VIQDFVTEFGGDIEPAEYKLGRDGGLVLLKGGGDFPYDVNGGEVVCDEVLFSFSCGGNFGGVEGL